MKKCRKGKKGVCAVLTASMIAMLLSGCGGGNTTGETQAAGTTATGSTAESCITIGVSGTPDLDPAIAATGSSLIAAINMYDTLVHPSDTDEGVTGRVADSWEVSDDGLVYTFNLKKGIKFHNGEELDITDTWQSLETLNALSQIDGVSIAEYSNGLEYNMYMNNQAAPLDDINVRRAINCLIDYDTICKTILVDSTLSAGPTPAGVTGHVDTAQFKFDIEQAKTYLAASSYADTYKDYPIEIVVNSDVADLEKIALMVQTAAQQIGMTITISKAPWVSLIDKMGSVETSPQITIINSAPPYDDAGVYLQSRYSNATQGTWENGEWLSDSTINDMIEDALGTTDVDARLQKYADIQNYIVDEVCPSAWLCDLTERCAYQSSYIKWPLIEEADGVGRCVNGYSQEYYRMEYHTELK